MLVVVLFRWEDERMKNSESTTEKKSYIDVGRDKKWLAKNGIM